MVHFTATAALGLLIGYTCSLASKTTATSSSLVKITLSTQSISTKHSSISTSTKQSSTKTSPPSSSNTTSTKSSKSTSVPSSHTTRAAVPSLTCPTLASIPTRTVTAAAFTTVYTGSTTYITFSYYPPAVTKTLYTSYDLHANVAGSTYTETDYITTETAIYNAPTQTTVTVPTLSGFTPIECYSDYFQVTTTITTAYTATEGDKTTTVSTLVSSTPTETVTSYTKTNSYLTTYTDVETTLLFLTFTTTSTRTHVTSTVYAACATNNVTPRYPGGGFWTGAFPNFNAGSQAATVLAQDPTDCCEICQGNSTCTGSSYTLADKRRGTGPMCTLFIKGASQDQTCDITFVGEQANGVQNSATLWISNSGCGKYSLLT